MEGTHNDGMGAWRVHVHTHNDGMEGTCTMVLDCKMSKPRLIEVYN